MNRSEGLVRRVKNRSENPGNSDQGASNSSANHNDDERNDNENDVDDCDSKETRLTLMEEVLLLGLKDKEVCWHG